MKCRYVKLCVDSQVVLLEIGRYVKIHGSCIEICKCNAYFIFFYQCEKIVKHTIDLSSSIVRTKIAIVFFFFEIPIIKVVYVAEAIFSISNRWC